MSIVRPQDEEPEKEGHSGKKFLNPKHEDMVNRVLPYLQN